MKRALCACALVALTAMTAACSKIFEDIGSDPHPPTARIVSLVHFKESTADLATVAARDTAPPAGRTVAWDSGGFTVNRGQKFQVEIAYTDAGGDILMFSLHDREGVSFADLAPTEQTYFSGTSGTVVNSDTGLEITGIAGRHRLQLWAEDSHGSRSEKVEFVVTLLY